MYSTGRKYHIFFIFWALSALYLCIGSLIHFHQYKIYGKKLVAEVVISKREHEISVKDAGTWTGFQTGSPAIIAEENVAPDLNVSIVSLGGPEFRPVKSWCLANSGLRAPPLA